MSESFTCNHDGILIKSISQDGLIDEIQARNKEPKYICFCDSNLYTSSRKDMEVKDALKSSWFVLPDGVSISVLAKLICGKKVIRNTGPDFMKYFFERNSVHDEKHFLLGATDDILERIICKIDRLSPSVNVVGSYAPPFGDIDVLMLERTLDVIKKHSPDIVWVALGAPKQELFMKRIINKFHDRILFIGVGAAFDFYAGSKKRSPKVFRVLGVEWFYRMITEDKRVFFRNIRCVTSMAIYILLAAVRGIYR